jgi:hypothetical protein
MTRKGKGPERIALPCGLPLSVVFSEDDIKTAMQGSGSVSYILGAKPGKKITDMGTPQIFKLVKNMIGYAIVPVDDDDLELAFIDQQCWFSLPVIPKKIVKDLDSFFRLVDDKLGTESIALLTYDPTQLGTANESEGWGVLIPKQSNTAGSCNYDPTSVAELKEDGVMIVGSAHSHPGMAAFASHTDIGDQANFDGVHITYGWKKGSKVTEYHIELQMAGGRFTYTPDQLFEQDPDEEVPEEVKSWVENVEKAEPAWKTISTQSSGSMNLTIKMTLPNGVPNPKEAGVIVDVLAGENKCPCCDSWIDKWDRDRRRCKACEIFLALPGEDMSDIRIERGKGTPPYESDALDVEKASADAWHWHREVKAEDKTKILNTIEKLFEAKHKGTGKDGPGKA